MTRPTPPGERSHQEEIARMIRVNHAGEYGALRIYAGQLKALGEDSPSAATIAHMKEQEEAHLSYFEDRIRERRVRPTALFPVWHVLGYALGYATAALGEKSAMACTVAVEDAIDDHYAAQERYLESHPEESPLRAAISRFRAEEQEHRDTGLACGAKEAPAYGPLYHAVKGATRAAIWLSKRL